jgi:hypothetical protein
MLQKLPSELLQMVLDYASAIYRDGEYISRIAKTDPRYEILKTIPTKKISSCLKGMKTVHVFFSKQKGSITYYEPVSTKVCCFYAYYLSSSSHRRANPMHYYIDLNQKIDKIT